MKHERDYSVVVLAGVVSLMVLFLAWSFALMAYDMDRSFHCMEQGFRTARISPFFEHYCEAKP